MTTPDIEGVMAAAMDAENRRRELAGQSPGLGALLPLEQPPAGPGVGLSDVPLPVVGEGYVVQAEIAAAVHKAYGAARPQYAHPLVGGIDYPVGIDQPALRRVTNLGADGLFIDGHSAPPADRVTVVAAPSRPSLWSRLAGKFRRRR